MQANLPNKKDRLTFIVCLPIPTENSAQDADVRAGQDDKPDRMIGIVNVLLSFENLVDDDLCVPLYLDTNFNVVITSKLHQGQGYERIILMALVSYVGSVEGAIFEEIMPGYDKDDDAEDFREISMLFGAKLKKENIDRRGEYETMGFRQIYEENNLGETTFRIVRGYVRLGKEENCHHVGYMR
jgi:hypothetical protein